MSRERFRLVREMDGRLEELDALVMPTTPIVAPKISDVATPETFSRNNMMLLRNPALVNFFDLCARSLPCAMLTAQQVRDQVEKIRGRTQKPVNVNFFCHKPPRKDNAREAAWRDRLAPYYRELGLDPNMAVNAPNRAPFDGEVCELME